MSKLKSHITAESLQAIAKARWKGEAAHLRHLSWPSTHLRNAAMHRAKATYLKTIDVIDSFGDPMLENAASEELAEEYKKANYALVFFGLTRVRGADMRGVGAWMGNTRELPHERDVGQGSMEMESGMPSSVIRLRMLQASRASTAWADQRTIVGLPVRDPVLGLLCRVNSGSLARHCSASDGGG